MEALHRAIQDGTDTESLQGCLDNIGEYRINSALEEKLDGQTALSQAVLSSNLTAAELLINW